VAKKELNLLLFAASGAAEPSTASTEIVRCEFGNASLGGELIDDVPDLFNGAGVVLSATNAFESQTTVGIEDSHQNEDRKIWKGQGKVKSQPSATFREGLGRLTNAATTNLQLSVGRAVASADALVAERKWTGCLCRILQCRFEIPRVAILIERQGHHAPELPGCGLDIFCVEVGLAGKISGIGAIGVG
jgi:hypothetical protein